MENLQIIGNYNRDEFKTMLSDEGVYSTKNSKTQIERSVGLSTRQRKMDSFIRRTYVRIKNERLLTKRETFCWILIIYLFVGLALWLGDLFAHGTASKQTGTIAGLWDFLADFFNVVGYSAKLDPYHNWIWSAPNEKAYPPLVYIIFYLFSGLVDIDKYYEANYFLSMYQEPLMIYVFMIIHIGIFVLIYEVIRNYLTTKRYQAVLIAFLVLFSGPMLYSLERANTIIITMLLVSVFLFNYDSNNKIKREIAVISLAFAASFKITPAILGILLLTERRNIKLTIRAIIYGILVFGIPFFFLNDNPFRSGVQLIRNIQANLASYSRWNGVTLEACLADCGIRFNETVMIVLKYLICIFFVYGVFIVKDKWKKVMMISLALIFLPNHSGNYCILYMIPSFVLFLNEKEHTAVDWMIFLPVLFMLQPHRSIITTELFRPTICLLLFCGVMVFFIVKEIFDNKRKGCLIE